MLKKSGNKSSKNLGKKLSQKSSKKSKTTKSVTANKKQSAKISKKSKVKKESKPQKAILKVSPITLQDGDSAPNFSVVDHEGKVRNLSDYKNQKLVLYFYPKDLTPGCTVEACDFRDSLNRLKSQGVEVLGVSMDDQRLHQKFIQTHGLNFPLLSDTTGQLCYDYGVLKEKNNYGKTYVGIVRKTFILENGKVLKVYPLVKAEGHVQQIINDLKTL